MSPEVYRGHDKRLQSRQLDNALRHIERAIALNPSLGYGYEQRGRLLIGLGRYDEAMAALETAVRLAPALPVTLLYMAWSKRTPSVPQAIRAPEARSPPGPGNSRVGTLLSAKPAEHRSMEEARRAFPDGKENNAPL